MEHKAFPTWLYHPTEKSIVVRSQKERYQLTDPLWRDTPYPETAPAEKGKEGPNPWEGKYAGLLVQYSDLQQKYTKALDELASTKDMLDAFVNPILPPPIPVNEPPRAKEENFFSAARQKPKEK